MNTMKQRLLSVFLCAVLLLSCMTAAAAAAAPVTPVIVVSGMNSFPLYENEIADENKVWPPEANSIVSLVFRSLPSLAKSLLKQDLNIFADATMTPVFETLFGAIACDETGEPLKSIAIPTFPDSAAHYPDVFLSDNVREDETGIVKGLANRIGADNVYFFNYDWRLDPMDDARGLKDFIDHVKAEKNASRVTLIPCSMGGTVVNAYLSLYGSDDVAKIVYTMVASKGIDLVGELFNGNVTLDLSVLTERLFNFKEGDLGTQALLSLLKTVTDGTPGLNQVVNALVKRVFDALTGRAYDEVFKKSLVTMPGMWAFVPEAYYESAKEKLFGTGGNETFLRRIDAYHYDVQNQSEDLMRAAVQNDVDIYVLAAYGFVGFPMSSIAYVQSDCLIETKNESFGATTATYGKTLGKDYTPAGTACSDKAHHHVSTDNIIDATTCLFPEQTWFLKHNRHVGIPCDTAAADLMAYLVMSEETVSVHSNEAFPQFSDLNLITGKLDSLTGDTVKESIFDRESNTLLRLLKFFKDLIETIKVKIQK